MSNADLALVAQSCPKSETIILDAISVVEEVKELEVQDLGTLDRGIGDNDVVDELGVSCNQVWKKIGVYQQVGDEGLCALANGCPKLSMIVIDRIEARVLGITAMVTSAASNLTRLDLENCAFVSDQVLEAVASSSCPLSFLNLRYCCDVTEVGLRFLANGTFSKSMKQLGLSELNVYR